MGLDFHLGHLEISNFPIGINGKLISLDVPLLKYITGSLIYQFRRKSELNAILSLIVCHD